MNLAERVRRVAKIPGSQLKLAEAIGVNFNTFSGYLKPGREDNLWPLLPRILEMFPVVNRDWLYFGEGEMLGANEGLTALKAENEELKAELEAERRLNRQLTAKLLVDGASDQDAATATGKASGGQG